MMLLLAAVLVSCAQSGNTDETARDTTKEAIETTVTVEVTVEDRILYVEDGKIIDKNGDEVVLCGINLGGWLLQETWMCAVVGSECNEDSFKLLQDRGFTDDEIATLFASYADHYITERDIKIIAELGLNCLRVPFWYRNFMREDLTYYTSDPDENPGFRYLDRVIAWAEHYGLYVILDMHGAPGGQSTDHCCGSIGKNELYTSEDNLAAMEDLWVKLATRYRDSVTVAAYDIMNEPMNNSTEFENGWAAGSDEAIAKTLMVYRRMIRAIRAIDPEHIITIEGIWSMTYLPDPAKEGWTNMMYQLHLYDTTKEMIDYRIAEMVKARDEYGVAIYVGEYNNGDDNQVYAYTKYRTENISRTAWTYKTAKGNQGNWSLYYSSTPPADLANDSYDEILRKWGDCLLTESNGWTRNTTLRGWLMRYSKPT
ncbi:MAG: cellulase family glycosylhydrolase [Clostridia bacterium]|nr:cellulase family glycosylhydrolase [Clostridia bacterium]